MRECKSTAVNMTKERVVILVKLCITLCGHTGVSHDNVHAVRNMDFHFPSRNRTLVDAQTIVEVIGNTGRIRAAHLTLTSQRIQNFVFRVSVEHTFEVD